MGSPPNPGERPPSAASTGSCTSLQSEEELISLIDQLTGQMFQSGRRGETDHSGIIMLIGMDEWTIKTPNPIMSAFFKIDLLKNFATCVSQIL